MRTFAVKQLFSNLNIAKILIKSYITYKIILYLGFLIISFTYIDKSTNNINLIIDAWALTSFLIFFPIHSLPYKNQECLVWKGENCWNNLWYYRPWRRKSNYTWYYFHITKFILAVSTTFPWEVNKFYLILKTILTLIPKACIYDM